MAQLDTVRFEARSVPHRAVVSAAGGIRMSRRAHRLAGALMSVGVGTTLTVMPELPGDAMGVVLCAQFAVQGVLQLLAAREARVPRPVRRLLAAGGLGVLLLAVSFFRNHADSVFLLGLWTGFGLLLRGFTMAVSMMPSSVSQVVIHDELLNAVIVSAGLFMTAFPFSFRSQFAYFVGFALIITGLVEAIGASRRRSRALRPLH